MLIRLAWITVLSLCLLSCRAKFVIGDPITPPDEPLILDYDFITGAQGWRSGFSDYDPELAMQFALESGVTSLPSGTGQGYYLAGTNRSDDLFMFIKIRVTGLRQTTRYNARLTLELLSNAGENCVGIGGAPGESVYVKFGFYEFEPAQAGYYLNADKGNQANGGVNARVIGNVAAAQSDCSGELFGRKVFNSGQSNSLTFTTDSNGEIWLFIGTDSGYEGRTEVYMDRITIELT